MGKGIENLGSAGGTGNAGVPGKGGPKGKGPGGFGGEKGGDMGKGPVKGASSRPNLPAGRGRGNNARSK